MIFFINKLLLLLIKNSLCNIIFNCNQVSININIILIKINELMK